MKLRGAKVTDKGLVKEINEDSSLLKYAMYENENFMLAVVADGMGGLSCGEVASSIAISHFENWYNCFLKEILMSEDIEEKLLDSWEDLLIVINKEIIRYGEENSIRYGLGTTLTAALLYKGYIYSVNIGDSRIYKMNEEIGLKQITRDDTWLQDMLDEIPPHIIKDEKLKKEYKENLMKDNRANRLTQCLGYNNEVSPSYYKNQLSVEDYYIVCSDGFRNKLEKKSFLEMIEDEKNGLNLKEVLHKKVNLVKSKKETDNITAILIKVID